MKQKTEKIVKNDVFTRDFKVDGPRTRSSIKQEIEDSKESMRCALYSTVKVEPLSSEIGKDTNSHPIEAFQHEPPIIDIINLYCDVCNKVYDVKSIYIAHLVRIHGMVLPDIYSEQKHFDPENRYCRLCDKKYKGMSSFKAHLQNIHHTELPSRPLLLQSTDDKNNYCVICDRKFGDRPHYLDHLARIHRSEDLDIFKGVDCAKPSKADKDGNRYCSDCHEVFMTRMFFQIHLDRIHGIKPLKPLKPPKKLPDVDDPDIDDPNNYCVSCNKTYASKRVYRSHLVNFHNLILPGSRIAATNNTAPVVDLLKKYCNYYTDETYGDILLIEMRHQ
ncbi:hypothetical protein HPULCUR_008861 [Helicostylum pulchrum]|uniref:C2H2-type domain-containing protein n=1 Tax=Helicostylum pulchrum TaxID=562976 RepID=A0ABP9Y8T7_9FUNG